MRGRPIVRNIGKVTLQPDIQLITGMAVIREGIVGGEANQRFAAPGYQIPTQERNLGARRDSLAREWLPDDLVQVDDGLILPKG
jgi:hypothetical protein